MERKALDVIWRLGIGRAKHETTLISRAALHAAEQVTIKSDLKEMFRPSTACQLGVPRLIGPSPPRTAFFNPYQEIGVAEPRTGRKGRLIDQGAPRSIASTVAAKRALSAPEGISRKSPHCSFSAARHAASCR
jgi:hypothetical protein